MKIRSEIALFGVSVVALGVGLALTLTSHPVPVEVWGLGTAALSGGLGIALPTGPAAPDIEKAVSSAVATLQAHAKPQPVPTELGQLAADLAPAADAGVAALSHLAAGTTVHVGSTS